MGRKSTYNLAQADQIAERIANGEPLRQICRDEGMPQWNTVYAWMKEHPEFADRIARARVDGFDALAQECLIIADTPVIGEEEEESPVGKKIKRGDMLGHRKLQIETRLKLLAKWDPKRYGERIEVAGDADNPLAVSLQVEFVKPNG